MCVWPSCQPSPSATTRTPTECALGRDMPARGPSGLRRAQGPDQQTNTHTEHKPHAKHVRRERAPALGSRCAGHRGVRTTDAASVQIASGGPLRSARDARGRRAAARRVRKGE
jgi:hypothetical protein